MRQPAQLHKYAAAPSAVIPAQGGIRRFHLGEVPTFLGTTGPSQTPHAIALEAAGVGLVAVLTVWYSGCRVGAWRSPGAHLHGVQGVAGSNPAAPTSYNNYQCPLSKYAKPSESLKKTDGS